MTNLSNIHNSITNQFIMFLCLISLVALACSPPPLQQEESKEKDSKQEAGATQEDYIPVEISAEMIEQTTARYPSDVEQIRNEGVVWVQSLVRKDGSVGDVKIAKTSGHSELDKAASAAAWTCKYKPGIQNGKPIAMWVTYMVEFKLQ